MEGQGSNSFASSRLSKLNLGSPLLRYLHSRSPLSTRSPLRSPLRSIENFQTPRRFKVEEDVVVMDGILLGSVPGGSIRSSAGSSSSGSNCWHSPRLKVPRVKEELRSHRLSNKNKSDEKANAKLCTFTSPGSCSHGAKCSFLHHLASDSESPAYVRALERSKVPKVSPMKLESSSERYSDLDRYTLTTSDWCPLDDDIDVSLPKAVSDDKSPSREAVNSHIDGVLYGPSCRKRLPVFTEFFPE